VTVTSPRLPAQIRTDAKAVRVFTADGRQFEHAAALVFYEAEDGALMIEGDGQTVAIYAHHQWQHAEWISDPS
jgi:hypothetical protein